MFLHVFSYEKTHISRNLFYIFPIIVIFPHEKIRKNKAMIIKSDNQMMDWLSSQPNLLEPLKVDSLEREIEVQAFGKKYKTDGVLQISFGDKSIGLLLEAKTITTLSNLDKGLEFLQNIKRFEKYEKYLSTLYVPFLSEKVVERLKDTSASGIDMNGNYYIVSPELVAIRLDKKNKFKEKRTIKEFYSRNSSIVARYLLKQKNVNNNLSFIENNISSLGFTLSLGTISKVLKSLEEDSMITRNDNQISVIQPGMLLDKLVKRYKKPEVLEKIYLRLSEDRNEARDVINQIIGNNNWIWTGESSAELYTSTTPSNKFYIYSLSNYSPNDLIGNYIDNKFYNYVIYYIKDRYVFFDSYNNYASNIQTFIELSHLDKREKEIAEDIKRDIINELT